MNTRKRGVAGFIDRHRGLTVICFISFLGLAGMLGSRVLGEVLKVSTAGQKVDLGKFVTTTTGYATSTALTVTVTISKNGGTFAARSSTVTPVSIGGGHYAVTLNDTDSNALGNLTVKGVVSGYLDCSAKCQVWTANAWDMFHNTGNFAGNLTGTLSTLTTYTGNTPQTGDSFARIGATGSGLTSLAPASTALTNATWTDTRAGYLTGAVALEATLTAIKGAGWTTETLKAIKDAVDLRLLTTGYTAPDNTSIGNIWTRVGLALPAVAPAANGGLGTVNASNQIAGIAGTLVTLDGLNTQLSTTHGAGSWATATGFSTHSAADVKTAIEAAGGYLALIKAQSDKLAFYGSGPYTVKASFDQALGTALTEGAAGRMATNLSAWWNVAALGHTAGSVLSTHTAADVAALILATPANKLATDGTGLVTFNNTSIAAVTTLTNWDKAGYSLAVAPPTLAQIVSGVWVTALPGAFTAGQAGYIVGNGATIIIP